MLKSKTKEDAYCLCSQHAQPHKRNIKKKKSLKKHLSEKLPPSKILLNSKPIIASQPLTPQRPILKYKLNEDYFPHTVSEKKNIQSMKKVIKQENNKSSPLISFKYTTPQAQESKVNKQSTDKFPSQKTMESNRYEPFECANNKSIKVKKAISMVDS